MDLRSSGVGLTIGSVIVLCSKEMCFTLIVPLFIQEY